MKYGKKGVKLLGKKSVIKGIGHAAELGISLAAIGAAQQQAEQYDQQYNQQMMYGMRFVFLVIKS